MEYINIHSRLDALLTNAAIHSPSLIEDLDYTNLKPKVSRVANADPLHPRYKRGREVDIHIFVPRFGFGADAASQRLSLYWFDLSRPAGRLKPVGFCLDWAVTHVLPVGDFRFIDLI